MSLLSLQVDPHSILGTTPGSTLREIRDAYHRKAKTYHPDAGGDEWAFRVLTQAYEVLSTERIARAARPEPARAPAPSAQGQPGTVEDEVVHQGVDDEAASDPMRVVEIERLWIRIDPVNQWYNFWEVKEDKLFLSCNLNILWPNPALKDLDLESDLPTVEAILSQLTESFREVEARTPVSSSSFNVEEHRFYGWLSYPSVNKAWDGLRQLREALHARGFSLKQWTRDLTIPRQWR